VDHGGGIVRRAGSPSPPSLSVVVNTYNWPEALDVVLRAFADQTDPAFEIVIADDGSSAPTADVVNRWLPAFGDRLVHVRHADEGFRRARILNLAAIEASGDCLAFMDGDCIPRVGFVASVRRAALAGWFLSTKRLDLGESFSGRVLRGELAVWRWSTAAWMIRAREVARRPGYFISLRDRRRPWRPDQADFDAPAGFFCAVLRDDFERVRGWDMRFEGWGCEDIDFILRLRRIGLRCGSPGPGATLLHLWHEKAWNPEDEQFLANEQLLFETQASERIEAVVGLREFAFELAHSQVSANRVGGSSASPDPMKR